MMKNFFFLIDYFTCTPYNRFLVVKTFRWRSVQEAVFTQQDARNTGNWVTEKRENTSSRPTSSRSAIAPFGLPERHFAKDPAMTRWRPWRIAKRFWCDMSFAVSTTHSWWKPRRKIIRPGSFLLVVETTAVSVSIDRNGLNREREMCTGSNIVFFYRTWRPEG